MSICLYLKIIITNFEPSTRRYKNLKNKEKQEMKFRTEETTEIFVDKKFVNVLYSERSAI